MARVPCKATALVAGVLLLAACGSASEQGSSADDAAPATDTVSVDTQLADVPPLDVAAAPDADPDSAVTDSDAGRSPGQVRMRRLTRTWYGRTVNALFGVSGSLADQLPSDTSAFGFDSLADHNTVSPVLVEAWERLASEAAAAIMTPCSACPDSLSWTVEAESLAASTAAPEPGVGKVLTTTEPLVTDLRVPSDGSYRFIATLTTVNFENNPPAVRFMVDGAEVGSAVVGPAVGLQAHEVSVDLSAGEHRLGVALVAPEIVVVVDRFDLIAPAGIPAPVPSRERVLTCTPPKPSDASSVATCAEAILRQLLPQVWRRPVDDAEVASMVQLVTTTVAAGSDFPRAVELAVQAALLSPHYVFLVETGSAATAQHELANRLAYFLWAGPPDAALTALADAGTLTTNLAGQIDRMLDDPRVDGLVSELAEQWLGGRLLDRAEPSAEHFPGFTDPLRESLGQETRRFLASFVAQDRDIRELVTSKDMFVDDRLAAFYGMGDVTNGPFVHVPDNAVGRGGVLRQAGLMTALSRAARTSPVVRGRWILEQLLCVDIPEPPADIPATLSDTIAGASLREQMAVHRADPACAGCHDLMDPLGFGLEGIDPIGRFRTVVEGEPVDTTGVLPDGTTFEGVDELVAILGKDARLLDCAASKVWTYAMGRVPDAEDEAALRDLVERWGTEGYRFRALLRLIATNAAFTSPSAPEATP